MKLRFADCILDLRVRQLERQSKIVPLEPKVYELLEALVKRRPAVVLNTELDELLWPQVYVSRTSDGSVTFMNGPADARIEELNRRPKLST